MRALQSHTTFICNFKVEFGSGCRADGQEKPCEVGAEAHEKVGLHKVMGLPSWPALLIVLKIKLSLLAKVPDLSVTL